MHWFALVNFLSASLVAPLAIIAWTRKDRAAARSFSLLMVSMAVYSVGLGFESLSATLETAWFWSRFQYIAIPFIPTLILVVILQFTGVRLDQTGMRITVVLCVLFSITVLVAHWTSPIHDLFYRDMELGSSGTIRYLAFRPGPLYFASFSYYILVSTLCIILMIRQTVVLEGVFRVQAVVVLIGLMLPVSFNVASLIGLTPAGLDMIPAAFSLGAFPLGYGLLNRGLLDIKPIAMRTVFSAIPAGCIIVDADLRLLEYNPAALRMLPQLGPFRAGDVLERLYQSLTGLGDVLQRITSPDQWEIWSPNRETHYRIRLSRLFRRSVLTGYLLILEDVSYQIEAENALRIRAERDGLTGVMNRRSFDEQLPVMLHEARQLGRPVSLILFDIDHFKRLNDTQGHQAGDAVLQNLASIVPHCLRSRDLIARYGGEEFAIVLPGAPEIVALEVSERLRTTVTRETGVTISLGVAVATPESSTEPYELIQMADRALYSAKQNGRDRVELWAADGAT